MSTFRAPLIAAAALTIISCAAFAQVRVITPDSEHVYSSDPARPQQLPDDEALQRQNERAERARIQRQRDREIARRQEESDAELARLRAGQAQRDANYWDAREKARRRANGGTGF
jgi:hypothetical protein